MFFPSTPNPIHKSSIMLDPTTDLNHFNAEFPLLSATDETNSTTQTSNSNATTSTAPTPAATAAAAAAAASTFANAVMEEPALGNFISPMNPITYNNQTNMNAGHSYDHGHYGFNLDNGNQAIPNEYYASYNNQMNTDSSLLSTSSIQSFFEGNEIDNTGYYSNQSQPIQLNLLISVNSFDNSHQNNIDLNNYYYNNPSTYQPSYQQVAPTIPAPQPAPQPQYTASPMANSISQNSTSSLLPPSYIKRESPEYESYNPVVSATGKKRYRVIRGVSAGGSSTRPPKQSAESDSIFLPVQLELKGAGVEDICYPKWSNSEKKDRRRIIRIERRQDGPKLSVDFSIIGSAEEHPETLPADVDVDVVEVSCLECSVVPNNHGGLNDDYDISSPSSEDCYIGNEQEAYQYYITSVEVVEIVELLIGTQLKDPAQRRRERGRVRSNLVPFWSKKSISSRMDNDSNSPIMNGGLPTNQDYRVELAKRIMGYEIRKPRGFDKEVRILRWDKLVPALTRALQSYYTEIPLSDAHLEF